MLRVGVMVDSLQVDAWTCKIIEDIRKSGFADIVFIVENAPEPPAPKPSAWDFIKSHWKRSLYHRYTAWDQARATFANDSCEQKSLSPLLDDVPRIQVQPLQKGYTDRFDEEDLEQIRAANLDVLFRFGFRIIRGPILNAAKYGVWSFHHGDNLRYRGGPHLFWEIYEKNPVSGSILQILTDTLDGGHVIYRSHAYTNLTSLAANRNAVMWKTAEFAMRRLRDLYTRGFDYIQSLPTYDEKDTYKSRIYHIPDTLQMLYFIAGQIYRRACKKLDVSLRGGRTQWFIAIRNRSSRRFDETAGYRIIAPPPETFQADPFLFEHGESLYLFYEDFRFDLGRAHISCREVNADGSLGTPADVLICPYHLSYPFVFHHGGEMYMIPETLDNRTIELYRASEFPYKWVLETTLMENIKAVDATIHEQNGKLWMFVNVAAAPYSICDELCIFYADDLLGPWTPHPQNPVVSDVRLARPAGRLFYQDGKLIRPSQDCAKSYGHALNFSEVIVLNEMEYEERPIAKVLPGWLKDNHGTHHYSRSKNFEAIDGKLVIK